MNLNGKKPPEIALVLVDIRSAHNVGAIFRTAEAAGIKKIYLAGYTPAPRDRFGRPVKEIAKTALGAENLVTWERVSDVAVLVQKLKAENWKLVALEQSAISTDYRKIKISGPAAVILGNEVSGLAPEILDQCDLIAEIPMRGRKESLNVAVAAGIFLFRLLE